MIMNGRPLNLAEATSDTSVRTLVVDDSPIMLKALSRILAEAGNFDLVGTATDGWQAVRYVSALSPELVLMDFHLPHLNGVEATRCIKTRPHPPVVIIVTADDSSSAKSMAEKAGADAFVSKAGDLSLQLTRTLQNRFGLSGAGRAAASGVSFQNPPAEQSAQDHRR